MEIKNVFVVPVLCFSILGGCAAPPTAPAAQAVERVYVVQPPEPPKEPTADELLRYIEHIRRAPVTLLEHEAHESERRLQTDPTMLNRMRQALFLAFAPTPYRSTSRAHTLLDGLSRESGDLQPLAKLLTAALQERLNLELALTEERKQKQDLRRKLDQLKAIEEDLGRDRQSPIINPR